VSTDVDRVVRRIVIAADQGHIPDDMASAALASGHHVRVARDGATAMQLLEDEPADLLLVDLALPRVSGFELARVVRARFGDQIRIVALADSVDRARQELTEAAGCDDLLRRPPTPGALSHSMRSAMASLDAR
jgi:two-component system OmpR family response regulator